MKILFLHQRYWSGFIVGDGKFVITNYHIVQTAKKIAVRNGTGIVSEARIAIF